MAVPTPKGKPVYLSDGTLWTPYPPLRLKPPEQRLSIEQLKSLPPVALRGLKIPEANPIARARAIKFLRSEPERKAAKQILDDLYYDVLKEIFVLYSDRSTEMGTRLRAAKWLNQKVYRFGATTLQSAALTEYKDLSELVRKSSWALDCHTGVFAPTDILIYLP